MLKWPRLPLIRSDGFRKYHSWYKVCRTYYKIKFETRVTKRPNESA
jgi:hypothetical protein